MQQQLCLCTDSVSPSPGQQTPPPSYPEPEGAEIYFFIMTQQKRQSVLQYLTLFPGGLTLICSSPCILII